MKRLAFENAAANGFEMPTLQKIDLEKESNIVYANTTPKTVYSGSNNSYSSNPILTSALARETSTGIGS